jgi:hypothetical protein
MDADGSRRLGAQNVTADLLDMLRALATVRGHAEMYRTPSGEYRMTGPDCLTGSSANRYVVAKPQLVDIMSALGVSLDDFLRDPTAAERVAGAVLEGRWMREGSGGATSEGVLAGQGQFGVDRSGRVGIDGCGVPGGLVFVQG